MAEQEQDQVNSLVEVMNDMNTDASSESGPENKSKEDICQDEPLPDVEASKSTCKHYTRLCKLKAVCCSKFYLCRFCHDDENFHPMDRHKVERIQCVNCGTEQGVGKSCEKCSTVFGDYFCAVCRLYDKDNKQFHCDKCGICRVGPKEDYFHCETCCACLSKTLEGNHKCIENMSKSRCPICMEFMHTSRLNMHIPDCGHMLHSDCLKSIFARGIYQCPLCKESLTDMSKYWEEMDAACASVVLPPELQKVMLKILCQDCHVSDEVKFNTEGLKCPSCGSYNTTQI